MNASAQPSARVLVVEDEPLLRLLNVDMLSDAGFDVIEAANGDDAIRVLETVDDIRFVFTDVEMPGRLDGFALARRIGKQWPEIGIVITSGRRYPDADLAPAARFVPKPFEMTKIVSYIDAFVHAHH